MTEPSKKRRLLVKGVSGAGYFCWKAGLHVLRVTLGVGIVMGVLGFSILLYVSEFSFVPRSAEPAVVQTAEEGGTPMPTETRPASLQWMQWVFGPPPAQPPANPPEPAAAPETAPPAQTAP